MKKPLNITLLISTAAALVLSIYSIVSRKEEKVIRYVRSQDLVYNYKGMKEAQAQFDAEVKQDHANLDTLESDYQKSVSKYQSEFSGLSVAERSQREQVIQAQMVNFQKFGQKVAEETALKEDEILQGVLNQVNSFSEEYARKNGIHLIYGTTLDGSLIYGDKDLDITDQLLKAMNDKYSDQ